MDKGQLYTFGDVTFCGNTLFSNEEILDQFDFEPGYWFSPEALRSTAQALSDLFGGCGYIDTSVDIQLRLRENCPVYDVNIIITEGEQYYIGLIKVLETPTPELQSSCMKAFSVQVRFSISENSKRLKTVSAIQDFFSNVNVYAVRSNLKVPNQICSTGMSILKLPKQTQETLVSSLGLVLSLDFLGGSN